MSLMVCVLAGGRGERFWPLSRRRRPKQLTNLTGEGTMLRLTVDRLASRASGAEVLVVTSEELVDAVRRELPEVPRANVVGEPVGRNSAPAIALAAYHAERHAPGSVMFVAPSDHVIDGDAFLPVLDEAVAFAAKNDVLVTFGIRPTRPETGYGYIERGDRLTGCIHAARSFREKPDRSNARRFVSEGRFLWNSGMFVWRARVLLDTVARHAPEISAALAHLKIGEDGSFTPASLARYYGACPSISIDYAVMERAADVAVCESAFTWCDVGSWAALGDVLGRDAAGNVTHGSVAAVDTEGCVFYAEGGRIAAIGVRDVAVVRIGEVTMVCPVEDAGRVRELVRALGDDPDWDVVL